jgi:hypothetical protein
MTTYYSATADARYAQAVRANVADTPARRWTRADVSRELKLPATSNPPGFIATAKALGWDDNARRLNAWNAAGQHGSHTDPEYDDPSPLDLKDGAL